MSPHPVVAAAVVEVISTFGEEQVESVDLPDGAVWLTVKDRDLGDSWTPSMIPLTVKLLMTYPNPPPYPFYVPATLRRTDGTPVTNLTRAVVDGVEYGQLSLNRPFDPARETLCARLVAAVDWIRTWSPGQ